MSRIKGKDTSIEVALRRELWKRGIRYRKNPKSIYGHPDIAIKKYKIAIFCDGDFWHGYNWEERKESIKSNRDYWIPKIERNMEKDIEVNHVLSYLGYRVIRFWEHEIKKDLIGAANMIERAINEIKSSTDAITVKKASERDIKAVIDFYDEVVDRMADAVYSPGWKKGIYPAYEDLEDAIRARWLYVAYESNQIIGCMVINNRMTDGYEQGAWIYKTDKLSIIHMLAVHPDKQNQGYGKAIVRAALRIASELGSEAVRLDVYSPNLPAKMLYESIGFRFAGSMELFYEDTGLAEYLLYEFPL